MCLADNVLEQEQAMFNSASWKQDSMNECFDIVNSYSRVRYLKIKREHH